MHSPGPTHYEVVYRILDSFTGKLQVSIFSEHDHIQVEVYIEMEGARSTLL